MIAKYAGMAKWSVALAALIIVAILAIPSFLSSSYVKTRISEQLSAITGRPVQLQGVSSVSLSPYLSVIYRDISIADTTPGADKPLVQVEALRAKLSVLSALWGGARLSEIHLIRPEFNLRIDRNGQPNFLLIGGPLADRLALPADVEIENLTLGTVTLEEAHIVLDDQRPVEAGRLPPVDATAVNGELNWSKVNSAASIAGTGIVRGELVGLSGEIDAPLALLRGAVSAASLDIKSAVATVSFNGDISLNQRTATGRLSANIPASARFMAWLGDPLPARHIPTRLSLDGRMQAAPARLEFLDSTFIFNDRPATGRMLVTRADTGRVKLSGTLAFDNLPLPQWDSLLALEKDTEDNDADRDMLGFDLDMRVSANEASSGPFTVSNLAAAAYVKDGKASFDIGQASAMGGTVSGSVDLERALGARRISTRVTLDDVDLEPLSRLYGQAAMVVSGKGDASFNLKTSGQDRDSFLRHLNGDVRVKSQQGQVVGLDLQRIVQRKEGETGDGSIVQQLGGETPFELLDLNVFIANGTAFFNKSTLSNSRYEAELGGRADVTTGSLALRGRVSIIDGAGEEKTQTATTPFFVGGSTSQPLIVPLAANATPKIAPAEPSEETTPPTQ